MPSQLNEQNVLEMAKVLTGAALNVANPYTTDVDDLRSAILEQLRISLQAFGASGIFPNVRRDLMEMQTGRPTIYSDERVGVSKSEPVLISVRDIRPLLCAQLVEKGGTGLPQGERPFVWRTLHKVMNKIQTYEESEVEGWCRLPQSPMYVEPRYRSIFDYSVQYAASPRPSYVRRWDDPTGVTVADPAPLSAADIRRAAEAMRGLTSRQHQADAYAFYGRGLADEVQESPTSGAEESPRTATGAGYVIPVEDVHIGEFADYYPPPTYNPPPAYRIDMGAVERAIIAMQSNERQLSEEEV